MLSLNIVVCTHCTLHEALAHPVEHGDAVEGGGHHDPAPPAPAPAPAPPVRRLLAAAGGEEGGRGEALALQQRPLLWLQHRHRQYLVYYLVTLVTIRAALVSVSLLYNINLKVFLGYFTDMRRST